MIDAIKKGATDQSVLFALAQAGLTITEFRLSYTRFTEGDGTSFTVSTSAMTALATITTAHTNNAGIYLSATATDGNKFLFRADVPDGAFATGADRVAISLYDDSDEEIAHREFMLSDGLPEYPEGGIFYDAAATANTGTLLGRDGTSKNPVTEEDAAKTLSVAHGGKKIFIKGTFDCDVANDLAGFSLEGINPNSTLSTISNSSLAFTKISKLAVAVDFAALADSTDLVQFKESIIDTPVVDNFYYNGPLRFENCEFRDDVNLLQSGEANLINCFNADASELVLDCVSAGSFNLVKFTGTVTLKNEDGGVDHYINMAGGSITIDSSCTSGSVILTGYGKITDNSGGSFTVDVSAFNVELADPLANYPEGGIFYDPTAAANTGTELGVDGTSDNPVTEEDAAETLAIAHGGKKIFVQNGTFDHSVAGNLNGFIIEGLDSGAVFSTHSTSSLSLTKVRNINVTVNGGVQVSGSSEVTIEDCKVSGNNYLAAPLKLVRCEIANSTMNGVNTATLIDCYTTGGNTLTLNGAPSGATYNLTGFTGRVNIVNESDAADNYYINMKSGSVVIQSSCDNGTITLSGSGYLGDSSTGTTVNTDRFNVIAGYAVDEWKTQSQADPTGFHVNVREWLDVAVKLSTATQYPTVDVSAISDDEAAANYLPLLSGDINDIPEDVDTELTANHGAGSWQSGGSGLTSQQVRDAMKLAPTGGAPAAGSVDEHLDDILTDTGTDIPALIAALNDISTGDVDSTITSNASIAAILQDTGTDIPAQISALNNIDSTDVQTACAAAITAAEPIDANLTQIGGSVSVDTIPIVTMFEAFIAALQGDVVRVGNQYSYKKQDGSTTAFSYTITTGGRS